MAVINRMANLDMKLAPLDAKGRARKPRKKKTRGQVVVEIWLRQRGLRWKPGAWAKGRDPLPADYAELARRIDSFRERVLIGAT